MDNTIDQLNVIKIKNICFPRNHDSQNKRKQWQSINLIKNIGPYYIKSSYSLTARRNQLIFKWTKT